MYDQTLGPLDEQLQHINDFTFSTEKNGEP